ncbi:hypothetical protein [Actinopolymorpha alba]|uniref:hypothetical protein n=1 Tax=Actinopolymorpha alba TaxID=533267 RepID=UPI0003A02A5B|nr:hypothetical protein [Actinopolymorpha alba]
MKIDAVETYLLDVPAVASPFAWRDGLPGSEPAHTAGVLRIRTDEGIDGIAYTRRGAILEDLVNRRLRAELLGADPLAREFLWHRLWELDRVEEFPLYTFGLVDEALWDIAGKAAGLPLHQLLGSFRSAIPAYRAPRRSAPSRSTSTSPTSVSSSAIPP